MESDHRRHPRFQYFGVVFVSWKMFDGQRNYALGKCLDVSEGGMGLELSVRVPVGSFVRVCADGLNLDDSATVKRVTRKTGGYILGLELSRPLAPELLEDLVGSQTELAAAS